MVKTFTWLDLEEFVEFQELADTEEHRNGILINYQMVEPAKLSEFLSFCGSTYWKGEAKDFTTNLEGSTVTVHPKEGRFSVFQTGLHYICQHFMPTGFPQPMRNIPFHYQYRETKFGVLKSLAGKEYDILCGDLKDGVMLNRDQCQYYDDNFVVFMFHRTKERGETVD
jgi:hypothetical protein